MTKWNSLFQIGMVKIMDYNADFSSITVQQMRIFITAVEVKNYTKVAEIMNFTPSMISKTIQSLENTLGIKLFTKRSREPLPTEAAVSLAEDWSLLLGSMQRSIEKASLIQQNRESRVVFGFVDCSERMDALMGSTISGFISSHPGCHVHVEKNDMHRLIQLLNYGTLDVIQTWYTDVAYLDEKLTEWEKAFTTSATVFVPRRNHLFGRNALDLRDLSGESLIGLQSETYSSWLSALFHKYGLVPDVSYSYSTVRSLFFNLRLGNHIFVGDSIDYDWCSDSMKMFLLPEQSASIIAWRRDASPAALDFKEYIKARYPVKYPASID